MKILDILTSANIAACPARFRQALSILIPLECEFEKDGETIETENVPGDSGGRTFAGIDESSNPTFPYNAPTPSAVVATYEKEWNHLRACELPHPVGVALFVQGTNQGAKTCSSMLQDSITNFGGKILVDGNIGPATVRAAWNINGDDLTRAFLAKSRARYTHIITNNPSLQKFKAGWLNRVAAIEKALSLA
jgi:lysozyme family protein